ncbi:hypothetical protein C2E20_5235 [Micractinium conductrix]|uniref:Uncharacterized protein n=1 Tax=Micractinium conductrix TaxID=554055 RepID=A0A2P6VAX0_9CHLO|nr:hypothetical protein C2E20_5235 [Micractinium conductrix]|eukprot:PSC71247.1 hypothetical protein C2E20_5235 [Micractinium conductrix]
MLRRKAAGASHLCQPFLAASAAPQFANGLLLLRATRVSAELPPAAQWLLGSIFVALLEIVFEDKPPGYLHWREVPTAILRLSSIPTLGLIRQLLDARVPPLPPPQPGGALAVLAAGGRAHLVHWALLVHASGLILPSATSICLRMRFSLSILVQLVQLAAAELATPGMCASAALSHPAAQRLTAQQYYALGGAVMHWLPRALAAPWAGVPRPASAAEQGAALMRLHRLIFGFMVPVGCELVMKSRIFSMHQAQREAAGLAGETGAHAVLFPAVYRKCWPRFLRK